MDLRFEFQNLPNESSLSVINVNKDLNLFKSGKQKQIKQLKIELMYFVLLFF